MARGRKVRLAEKAPAFLAAIAAGRTLPEAAKAARMPVSTAYDQRARDSDFARAWDDAARKGDDARVLQLEAEADRRAIEGVNEPVFHEGRVCGHKRRYSDTLLIFRLKALRPDKYRERAEIMGGGGGPLEVIVRKFGDDRSAA